MPDLEKRLAAAHPDAKIATIGGRYYAMDRDKRWERTGKGYEAIVHGVADHHAPSAIAAVEQGYARGENDEFIVPTVIDGVGHGTIADGDAVLHCNFRPIAPASSAMPSPTPSSGASTGTQARRCPRASSTRP